MIQQHGATTISGPKSRTTITGQIATVGREWLRQEAELLEKQYAQFGPLFRNIFYYEVAESLDAPAEVKVDMWEDGDIFEETMGVVSQAMAGS